MKAILLSGKKAAGRAVIVDDADWPLVAGYRWRVHEQDRKPGYRPLGPYAVTSFRRDDGRQVSVFIHKMITGYERTDHINHDGLDNRRTNLRPATRGQNGANQRSQAGSTSRYKGAGWDPKRRTWKAQIAVDGKRRHLGYFALEEDAALAYNAAALDAFGEYACLNQIEDAA